MTRSILRAAAASLGLLAGAASQAQGVSVYGLADIAVGRFQPAGEARTWRAESGGLSNSYIGFRAIEDLGGGLKARFQLEHYLRLDQGMAGRYNGDAFWGRSASVGFQGSFGTSLLGRNLTPLYQSTALLNPFADSFGFSPTMRQYFGETIVGDVAWNNSLHFASPANGRFSFNLIGNLGEGVPGATGKNVGANVIYFSGPLAATIAWQQVRNGLLQIPAGFERQTTVHVGLAYDLGVAKLFGQYGDVNTHAAANVNTRLYQVGAAVPLTTGLVLASYGHSEDDDAGPPRNRATLSLGYDHFLSKNTDIYAVFMHDRLRSLGTGRSLAAGLRVRF